MHPWPPVALLRTPRAGGLPQHFLSSRQLQLVAPEKAGPTSCSNLQLCVFFIGRREMDASLSRVGFFLVLCEKLSACNQHFANFY